MVLWFVPIGKEGAHDAAVIGAVTIEIGKAFPDTHRSQMRRLEGSDMPLVAAIIGNAVQPDLAARPGLHTGPFDTVVVILGFARRIMVDKARRAARAAGIDTDADIVMRHPFFRVDHFPILVFVA